MNSLIYFFFNTIFFIGNYDDFFYRFIFIRFRKFNWLLTIDSHFNYNFSLRIDQILTSRWDLSLGPEMEALYRDQNWSEQRNWT